MKQQNRSEFGGRLRAGAGMWILVVGWWMGGAGTMSGWAAEPPRLAEPELESRLRRLEAAGSDLEQLDAARSLLSRHAVSSLQVKALARKIRSEEARLEFALAAYPRTVDPENFYEVYDAFQSFSKVFRLHDRIGRLSPGEGPPAGGMVPAPLSKAEWAELLRVVRKESFDNTRLAIARQVVAGARGRITSRQVREMLSSFTFEDGRLELAKVAYDSVVDPWNYHVVYDAFTFAANREKLVKYLESRSLPATPEMPQPNP
ncbi:MAG: DUF4476 domain-containing protein [Verrucomicrobiales bacterium]|nr:DUF4476 domain-containing protein [Verrucomicrobiales bacterium]